MIYQRSSQLFAEAEKVIPGGVNSPVRAFKGVGGTPIFAKSAKGAYLYDEDDNRFSSDVSSSNPYFLPISFHTAPARITKDQFTKNLPQSSS